MIRTRDVGEQLQEAAQECQGLANGLKTRGELSAGVLAECLVGVLQLRRKLDRLSKKTGLSLEGPPESRQTA